MPPKRALIIGVSGQDGAYLSAVLLGKGYEVHGSSRDSAVNHFASLRALNIFDAVAKHSIEPTDFRSVLQAIARIEPCEVYNLSGQSSVGLSFQQPVETLESISVGTLNILEAIRFLGISARFYNAGSSECFGDTGGAAANEATAFHPRSPYAVAKATAYWVTSNYRDAYELFACSGILFNHESPLRPERFVTQKIVKAAARIWMGEPARLSLGRLDIRRDWGWAPEYVEAMWRMLQQPTPADYVIATGTESSLQDFVAAVFSSFDLDWGEHVDVDESLFRPSEISRGVGDATLAERKLGWSARTRMPEVATRMADAERSRLRDSG